MYHVIIIIHVINFEEDRIEIGFEISIIELEMELKSPELELELKLIVSSGIGIENSEIGIELKKMNWPQPCQRHEENHTDN